MSRRVVFELRGQGLDILGIDDATRNGRREAGAGERRHVPQPPRGAVAGGIGAEPAAAGKIYRRDQVGIGLVFPQLFERVLLPPLTVCSLIGLGCGTIHTGLV